MVQMMIGMMIGEMKRWRDKKLPNRDVTKFQVPTTLMSLFGCCPCAKISQLSAAEQALIYAEVSKKNFLALGPYIRKDFKKPTKKDFYKYIFNHWPMFSSFQGPALGEIILGQVKKATLS